MHLPPRLACFVAALLLAAPAWAQLGLPALPSLPSLPVVPRLPEPRPAAALQNTAEALQGERQRLVRALLREHGRQLEPGPGGEPVRRGELVLVDPADATLAEARAAGFLVLRDDRLGALGLRRVLLQAPPRLGTLEALDRLRTIDPDADVNPVYTGSGSVAAPLRQAAAAPVGGAARSAPRRVGMVDGGIDATHPVLCGVALQTWGCAAPTPSPHGTAVASLLAGRGEGFAGTLPGAALHAADVYCGQPAAGRAEAVGDALAWMASEGVGLVNDCLVGPPNRLLGRAVEALLARGHLVVAAVGNDGPAAAPLYPAAYPGVVGVTGVTPARRVLPEAVQGAQVAFAAPGAELAVAQPGGGYRTARGTSFAAPLVAGLLAERLPAPDAARAAAARVALEQQAEDLGAPGRDPVYGAGLVGEAARVPLARLQPAGR